MRLSGGGAVTIADGADVALGARADAAATTDTGTFSLIALFKRLLQKFTTQFPAALIGGRFDVNIGNQGASPWVSTPIGTVVTASFTRPANTIAYSVADVISDSTSAPTIITLSGCARISGGTGKIVGAEMVDSANQTTKLNAALIIFDTAPTAINDNTVIALTDAQAETIVAVIRFDFGNNGIITNLGSGASGNIHCYGMNNPGAGGQQPRLEKKFKCAVGSTNLFAMLVAVSAYTPVSAEKFTFRIGIDQD